MDEREPVEDNESVYRRIHGSFFDPSVPVPIRRGAFRPNPTDTTGLSVFRARFLQPASILANIDPAKATSYYVARLSVRDLRNLGLTVVPEPAVDGPPGHAVIPELSLPAYEADKQRLKQILFELAKLASADIVHRPARSGR
jgi:hypothetical protein